MRLTSGKTLVIASGYFNPLGSHHLKYLQAAADYGDKLIIILNNDLQVKLKGSIPFQSYEEREKILNSLWFFHNGNNIKPPFIWRCIDDDSTVCKTLRAIYHLRKDVYNKIVFCNGGDRTTANPKEQKVCDQLGIEMIFGVGGSSKTGASSKLIEDAAKIWAERNGYKFPFPNLAAINQQNPPAIQDGIIKYERFM